MTSAFWLHLLFGSGVSGVIYQVVWVRQFGQIYGNTVYSASIVVAVFMLGLGAGSYVFGVLADRAARPSAALRAGGPRRIWGSAYLGAMVPDSAEVHNILGLAHVRAGRVDAGIEEFEAALARDSASAREPGTNPVRAGRGAHGIPPLRRGHAVAPTGRRSPSRFRRSTKRSRRHTGVDRTSQ